MIMATLPTTKCGNMKADGVYACRLQLEPSKAMGDAQRWQMEKESHVSTYRHWYGLMCQDHVSNHSYQGL